MNLGFRHLVCWHLSRNVRMLMLKMQRKKFSTLGQTLTVPNHKKSSKATTYVPWCPSFLECFPVPSHFPYYRFFSFTHFISFFFLSRQILPPPFKPANLRFPLLFFPFCSTFQLSLVLSHPFPLQSC